MSRVGSGGSAPANPPRQVGQANDVQEIIPQGRPQARLAELQGANNFDPPDPNVATRNSLITVPVATRLPSKLDWNYPEDPLSVRELDGPPEGFDPSSIPGVGTVKYFATTYKSSASPRERHTTNSWMQYDDAGKVIASGWIVGKENPDFLWRRD